jgi:hypothetical protein
LPELPLVFEVFIDAPPAPTVTVYEVPTLRSTVSMLLNPPAPPPPPWLEPPDPPPPITKAEIAYTELPPPPGVTKDNCPEPFVCNTCPLVPSAVGSVNESVPEEGDFKVMSPFPVWSIFIGILNPYRTSHIRL